MKAGDVVEHPGIPGAGFPPRGTCRLSGDLELVPRGRRLPVFVRVARRRLFSRPYLPLLPYEVHVPENSEVYLKTKGDDIMLFTVMAVKEDFVRIYGFTEREA